MLLVVMSETVAQGELLHSSVWTLIHMNHSACPPSRARLAIRVAIDHMEKAPTTPSKMMAVLVVISTHLEALREACDAAVSRAKNEELKVQIKGCSRSLSGCAAAFVAAVKYYVAHPSESSVERPLLFAKPMSAAVQAVVSFALQEDEFYGAPGVFSPAVKKYVKPIQAAGVSLVSASALFFNTLRLVLTQATDPDTEAKLSKYMAAVDVHLGELSGAVQAAYSADLMS
eukprot:m.66151 g.66151  ORF g.66151 m.66151 type:complete len:229 (-) comp13578_c0_seq1:214-900(-)